MLMDKKFTKSVGEWAIFDNISKDNYKVCPKCGTTTKQIELNKWDKVEDFFEVVILGVGIGLFLVGEAISEKIFKKVKNRLNVVVPLRVFSCLLY